MPANDAVPLGLVDGSSFAAGFHSPETADAFKYKLREAAKSTKPVPKPTGEESQLHETLQGAVGGVLHSVGIGEDHAPGSVMDPGYVEKDKTYQAAEGAGIGLQATAILAPAIKAVPNALRHGAEEFVAASAPSRLIGGEFSKTADREALKVARKMEKSGASAEDIHKETGWEKGKDTKWRYAFSDKDAKVETITDQWQPLDQVLVHDEAFKAYPQLKRTEISLGDAQGHNALWDPKTERIVVDPEWYRTAPPKEIRETILHETQHNVQSKGERFSTGLPGDDPHYDRALGEVEARNVEARAGLSSEESRATSIRSTQDTPEEEIIAKRRRGFGGAVKEKGGNWGSASVNRLSEGLANNLEGPEAGRDLKSMTVQARRMVSGWLNKHAGTETDPLKDVVLPSGSRLEDVTDRSVFKAKVQGPKGEEPQFQVSPTYTGDEGVNAATAELRSYMRHVGDYLKQSVKPEDLPKYDLVRAVRETAAKDAEVAAQAIKSWTKPNPERIANTQALPEVMSFPSEKMPKRKFEFNKPGSKQQKQSIDLPEEELGYSLREIALPKELTPAQSKNIKLGSELSEDERSTEYIGDAQLREELKGRYYALDHKGKPIVNNFTDEMAIGTTPQEAYLAGQLAHEGNTLGHCVGGYSREVVDGNSKILTLRDSLGRSYVTIEATPKGLNPVQDILQIKGPNNGPVPEYARKYIQQFVKEGTWGDVADLENIGLREHPTTRGKYITEEEYATWKAGDPRKSFPAVGGVGGGLGFLGDDDRGIIRKKELEFTRALKRVQNGR